MENQDLGINFSSVWIIVIINTLLIIFGAYSRLENLENSTVFLAAGLILSFITWAIIMIDIIKSKIYNKSFWLMTMIFMPWIASIFYMTQRKKLMKI
jgi:hypothetical protein